MPTTLSKKDQILKTYFKPYTRKDLLALTKIRRFETKLGEKIQVVAYADDLEKSLAESTARFVIVGIPEDLGVKANYGVGGANTAWTPFLQSFLNVQSNDFLEGSNILVLGHYDFAVVSDLIESNAHGFDEKIDAYRHSVYTVDEAVEPLIKMIRSIIKFL